MDAGTACVRGWACTPELPRMPVLEATKREQCHRPCRVQIPRSADHAFRFVPITNSDEPITDRTADAVEVVQDKLAPLGAFGAPGQPRRSA